MPRLHHLPDCRHSRPSPKRHGVHSETIIALDFRRRIILIGGTSYAGEMKKSVFTTLNYYLPAESVMPMHCSANVRIRGDVAMRFFDAAAPAERRYRQFSTLSATTNTVGVAGVFNFQGGCCMMRRHRGSRAGNLRHHQALRHGFGKCGVRSGLLFTISTTDRRRKNLQRRLVARLYPQRFAHRPRRNAKEHCAADGRRLRCHAANRQVNARAGDVSFPLRLYRQGRGH